MFLFSIIAIILLVRGSSSGPVSQPTFSSSDYNSVQSLVPQQDEQPLYISIPRTPPPQPAPTAYTPPQQQEPLYAPPPPSHVVPQLLLPSNVDRQVQRVATKYAGPGYAESLGAQQQQEQAKQVQAAAERRAAWQASRQRQAIVEANEALARAAEERKYAGSPQYHVQYQPESTNTFDIQSLYQPQAQASYQVAQPQYQLQTAVRPSPAPKIQYQPQPVYQPAQRRAQGKEGEEEEVYDDTNASYKFGFDVTDDENTNYHNRQEQRDGKKISGSYSVVDSDGFLRTVTYTADPKEGFKAEVVRKPTDIVVKIPKPTPPPQPKEQYIQAPKNVVYQYE